MRGQFTRFIRLLTLPDDNTRSLRRHVPMFVDRDFCDFSQEIGLASLGASDDDITRLARCYWYSVEFGLCREEGKNKAYGAGLLSSFGELEYACRERSGDSGEEKGDDDGEERPEIRPWDPEDAANLEFPITKYQPVYFIADSLQTGKLQMRKYCEGLSRPFHALFNPQTETVHIDRPVRRSKGVPGSD